MCLIFRKRQRSVVNINQALRVSSPVYIFHYNLNTKSLHVRLITQKFPRNQSQNESSVLRKFHKKPFWTFELFYFNIHFV